MADTEPRTTRARPAAAAAEDPATRDSVTRLGIFMVAQEKTTAEMQQTLRSVDKAVTEMNVEFRHHIKKLDETVTASHRLEGDTQNLRDRVTALESSQAESDRSLRNTQIGIGIFGALLGAVWVLWQMVQQAGGRFPIK